MELLVTTMCIFLCQFKLVMHDCEDFGKVKQKGIIYMSYLQKNAHPVKNCILPMFNYIIAMWRYSLCYLLPNWPHSGCEAQHTETICKKILIKLHRLYVYGNIYNVLNWYNSNLLLYDVVSLLWEVSSCVAHWYHWGTFLTQLQKIKSQKQDWFLPLASKKKKAKASFVTYRYPTAFTIILRKIIKNKNQDSMYLSWTGMRLCNTIELSYAGKTTLLVSDLEGDKHNEAD